MILSISISHSFPQSITDSNDVTPCSTSSHDRAVGELSDKWPFFQTAAGPSLHSASKQELKADKISKIELNSGKPCFYTNSSNFYWL